MAQFKGQNYFLREVMELMRFEIIAQASKKSNLVPAIAGDPGIGKSASIKALAEEMNTDCLIMSLGALPMEWFSGLPDFNKIKINKDISLIELDEVKVTEWTMSDIVRIIMLKTEHALANGKDGLIILLDDLHLVEPYTQKYLFEFFQNKTLQNFRLPEKAYLVAAMNISSSAGFEGFNEAVLDRMSIYSAKFDRDYWYDKIGATLHPLIASFTKDNSNMNLLLGANEMDTVSPSPRSWTELSTFLEVLEENARDEDEFLRMTRIASASRVGDEATREFIKHSKLFQKYNFSAKIKKGEVFEVSDDLTEQILTGFVIRYMNTKKDAKFILDLINANKDKRTFVSTLLNEYNILNTMVNKNQDHPIKEPVEELASLLMDSDDNELIDLICSSMTDLM